MLARCPLFSIRSFAFLLLPCVAFALGAPVLAADPVRIVFDTSKGEIVAELYPDKAPKTVENFLAYVRDGHYDGTIVYRIESFLIQAGSRTPDLMARETREPIPNEADNGLSNARGSIGMARWGPHTATAEYYINTRDNSHLDHGRTQDDFGYTVFGKVVRGMDVVDAIAALPTTQRSNLHALPQEEVLIKKVSIAEPGSDAATAPAEDGAKKASEAKKGAAPPSGGEPVTMSRAAVADESAADTLRLTGKLTAEGVECPAFRSTQGELYTLLGDLGGFHAGDAVTIEAESVEMSMCMQGTTVKVLSISAADAD